MPPDKICGANLKKKIKPQKIFPGNVLPSGFRIISATSGMTGF
jgi:hypothetical protein